jgi:hypothetical protein
MFGVLLLGKLQTNEVKISRFFSHGANLKRPDIDS